MDSGSIEVRVFIVWSSTVPTTQPDDTDDAGVTVNHDDSGNYPVNHDDGRNYQNVGGQEREIDFAWSSVSREKNSHSRFLRLAFFRCVL